jgi:1-acyl-sn-glycerol-3-phosphate acyltransferase
MLLRNVDKGMFVVTFLEPIDYAKPYDFDVKKHEVYMVEFNIDDKKKFNDIYEYAKR